MAISQEERFNKFLADNNFQNQITDDDGKNWKFESILAVDKEKIVLLAKQTETNEAVAVIVDKEPQISKFLTEANTLNTRGDLAATKTPRPNDLDQRGYLFVKRDNFDLNVFLTQVKLDKEIMADNGQRYRLDKILGKGAMGKAILGTQINTSEKVVIKIPNTPELEPKFGNQESQEEALNREAAALQKEGSLLGKKTGKPGEKNQSIILIIPLYPGKDLQSQMYNQEGKTTELNANNKNEIAAGILQEASRLQQLHIAHCDWKLDNIMYDKETGKVKIIDFGQALDLDKPYRHPIPVTGDLTFLPPEYVNYVNGQEGNIPNTHDDAITEQYAVGMVLAQIYSNEANIADVKKDIQSPNFGQPDISPQMVQLIRHLTHPNPAMRPASLLEARGIESIPEMLPLLKEHAYQKALQNFNIDLIEFAKKSEIPSNEGEKAKKEKGAFFSLKGRTASTGSITGSKNKDLLSDMINVTVRQVAALGNNSEKADTIGIFLNKLQENVERHKNSNPLDQKRVEQLQPKLKELVEKFNTFKPEKIEPLPKTQSSPRTR